MVKIHGLGGEFGIPKDQIQAILKAGQTQQPGLSISDLEASARPSSAPAQKPAPASSQDVAQPSSQGETKPAVNDAEEKEYQKRLAEVTQKLEAAKHDYFKATQGGGPSSSATKDGYRALTADLMSRLKDRRGASPSEYEPQEKELSDLRNQIDRLEKERDALIQEMQNKNYRTGSF